MFKMQKIRVSVFCAKNICKRDFFRLPDPFAKILVDGSGQCHATRACKATLDPKWDAHYDLYLSKSDSITISIWNQRKIHKKNGSGFLGCCRIMSNVLSRLKNAGFQRLDLCRQNDAQEPVRGQIVVKIESRDLSDRIQPNIDVSETILRSSVFLESDPHLPDRWDNRRSLHHLNQSPDASSSVMTSQRSSIIATSAEAGGSGSRNDVERSRRHKNFMSRNQLHGHLAPLPEGYEQRTTQHGQVYFLHTQTGVSSWHDPRVPRNLSNIDPSDLGPLPPDWELRSTATGRLYYVCHSSRTTQFTDPRISRYIGQLQTEIDANGGASTATRELLLQQQLNRDTLLFPRYKRDLVHKLKVIRSELQSHQPPTGHCHLEVKRSEAFEQSYSLIMKMKPKDLKKRLAIKFTGEEGLDYGGLAREWLYILSHEMLNPYYGLFQYSREDIYTLQINPDSHINPDHLSYFHFVGRILGMAVYHGHYIDGGFTMLFYKQLLGKPISLSDMEEVDPNLYTSMRWLLDNDITGILDDLTFCAGHDSFGKHVTQELKPNGESIAVTELNKKEYVKLYINWRYLRGIEAQFLSLSKGFYELIPQHLLRPFDERELELIICGLGSIDVDDWKRNTKLKHCTSDSNIVKWFWKVVENFDEEQRARLLQFVTGSSRVPLQGFKALQGATGSQGPRLFTIQCIDNSTDCLPKAHTCFNRIDMPAYESYEKLYNKLTCAVENTCGFYTE